MGVHRGRWVLDEPGAKLCDILVSIERVWFGGLVD
jgi:hypothetical protein